MLQSQMLPMFSDASAGFLAIWQVIQSERCFGAGHAARHWQALQALA